MVSLEKITIEKSLRLGYLATNNEAKYEALLTRITMVKKLGGKAVEIFLNLRLVIGQINGELEARDQRMQGYLNKAWRLQSSFGSFSIQQVPRSKNTHVDSLATLATSSGQGLPWVIVFEDFLMPTDRRQTMVGVHQLRVSPSWIDPLVSFMKDEVLADDKGEVEKIRRKAPRFWLSEEQKLYKRHFFRPYLLCVHPEVVEPLLEELHKGICGSHMGGRFLSHRDLTQGYWWPSMQKAAQDYAKKCDQCQRFALSIHQPGGALNALSSPWSFAQWGLDIVGLFPRVVGNRRWLLVGTDYLTKWVEVELLSNIRDVDAKKFVWNNIVTRFGIPHTLISDNELQFNSKAFRRYCCELGVRNRYSTPTYPQGNG